MNRSAYTDDLPHSIGTDSRAENMVITRTFPVRFRPQSEGTIRDGFLSQGEIRTSGKMTVSPAASYPQNRTHSFEEQRTMNQSRPVSAHSRFHRVVETQDHWNRPNQIQFDDRADYRSHFSSLEVSTHGHETSVCRTDVYYRFLALYISDIFIT